MVIREKKTHGKNINSGEVLRSWEYQNSFRAHHFRLQKDRAVDLERNVDSLKQILVSVL